MEKATSVTIRMDTELKRQAEMLFDDMGMNITTAFTIFAKAAVRQGKIPFEIVGGFVPNAETVAAMEESSSTGLKTYNSVDELFAELNEECEAGNV